MRQPTPTAPLPPFQPAGVFQPAPSPSLIACETCGRADETLRITVLLYTISIIILSFKRGWSGILCRTCRRKHGTALTLLSLLYGWWGFPWGIVYTLQAVFTNLRGGIQPTDANAQLLAYQGLRFIERREYVLGTSCLSQSLALQPNAEVASLLEQYKSYANFQSSAVRVAASGSLLHFPAKRRGPTWAWGLVGLAAVILLGLFLLPFLRAFNVPAQSDASAINLSAADLEAGFVLSEEQGKDHFAQDEIRDGSRRMFEQGDHLLQSMVLVQQTNVDDSIPSLLSRFESEVSKEATGVQFGTRNNVALGDRGLIEDFTNSSRTVQGYVLIFVKHNVFVMLFEADRNPSLSSEGITRYGRLIEQRIN